MPKAKPDRVVIHRIEFQDKERELLEAFIATQAVGNVGTILDGLGVDDFVREISKMLDDPLKILQVAYSLATILEMMGWQSRWPTATDFVDWFLERDAKMEQVAAEREFHDYPDNFVKQIVDMFRNLLGMPYKPYDYNIFNEAGDGSPATPFGEAAAGWASEFGEGGTQ
jgi:hypothetical protein